MVVVSQSLSVLNPTHRYGLRRALKPLNLKRYQCQCSFDAYEEQNGAQTESYRCLWRTAGITAVGGHQFQARLTRQLDCYGLRGRSLALRLQASVESLGFVLSRIRESLV